MGKVVGFVCRVYVIHSILHRLLLLTDKPHGLYSTVSINNSVRSEFTYFFLREVQDLSKNLFSVLS